MHAAYGFEKLIVLRPQAPLAPTATNRNDAPSFFKGSYVF